MTQDNRGCQMAATADYLEFGDRVSRAETGLECRKSSKLGRNIWMGPACSPHFSGTYGYFYILISSPITRSDIPPSCTISDYTLSRFAGA